MKLLKQMRIIVSSICHIKSYRFGLLFCTAILSASCGSNSNATKSPNLTTYQVENGDSLLLLNGVTENNKVKLANQIFETLNSSTKAWSTKYVDSEFVDADKYCLVKEGFDSTLCWSASASNILRISSWGDEFVNPIVKESTSYEDDLFAFFTSSFTDQGNLPEYALSYYFDGLLGSTTSGGASLLQEASEIKPSLGSSFLGYMPKLCSTSLASSVLLEDQPDYLSQIEKLDQQAVELSIVKIDTETKETLGSSGHSMTLTGVLMDKSKSGNEKYTALLLADSDNEESATDLPTSFTYANQVKREKPNSYTLYFTDTFDGKFGFYYGNHFAQITELTCLPFKNQVDVNSYFENQENATCLASKNADLTPTFLSVYAENNYSTVFKLGEKIYLNYFFVNRSDTIPMNQENAGKKVLENELKIYRNKTYVGSIKEGLSYNLTNPFKPKDRLINQITLTDSSYFTTSGEYEVQLVLNTNGCKEAYILNNESKPLTFTIK